MDPEAFRLAVEAASFPVLASPAATALRGFSQLRLPAGEQVQHGHSNRHPVGHLFENHAMWPVSDIGIDFDAAIHWTGVQNQNVARRAIEPLARDSEDAVVFARGRYVSRRHPLELEPQDVQRLSPFDGLFDPVEDSHAELIDRVREQRPRSAHSHLGPELGQTPDIRPRDARMENVTADADAPTIQISKAVSQRENVQQSLSGMLVRSVARIDDVGLNAFGEKLRRP